MVSYLHAVGASSKNADSHAAGVDAKTNGTDADAAGVHVFTDPPPLTSKWDVIVISLTPI